MLKLKTILEQAGAASPYYDVGKDFNAFVQTEEAQTEQLRQKYSQAMDQRLRGKRIRARASIGFKQFVKDYEFDVHEVRIEDYYDEYVIIAHGNDGRRERDFFLIPKYKVQILGNAKTKAEEPSKEETPQPEQPQVQPQPVQAQPKPQPQPQPPEQQVKENASGIIDKEDIIPEMDRLFRHWVNSGVTTKTIADRARGNSRNIRGKTIIMFSVDVPRNDLKSPFDANKFQDFVSRLTKKLGDLTVEYSAKVDDIPENEYINFLITKVVKSNATDTGIFSRKTSV